MNESRAQLRCQGCDAASGEQHDKVCDVARCRATGLQWQSWDHSRIAAVAHEPDLWTGRWPNDEDCERLGFFTRLVPGRGWVVCAADQPDAQPDLNRLYVEASWDATSGQGGSCSGAILYNSRAGWSGLLA